MGERDQRDRGSQVWDVVRKERKNRKGVSEEIGTKERRFREGRSTMITYMC